MSDHEHLDVDALADVLAGERPAPDCADCAAALVDLEAASAAVVAQLASLPSPALPDDLAARLDAALVDAVLGGVDPAAGTASVTTLPTRDLPTRAPRRWLPAVAAGVVLVGGLGLGAATLSGGTGSDDGGDTTAAAESDKALAGLVRNDTGSTYDAASLPTAVPGLLSGSPRPVFAPQAALPGTATGATGGGATSPDASPATAYDATTRSSALAAAAGTLDRLRTPEGLAECLVALLPPDDESVQPLALDYGSFVVDGAAQPALVVVLPVPRRDDKVDVFVVGAGCAQADEQLLHFARVDRP